MNFGNREVTQAVVNLLKSIYPPDIVIPFRIATTIKDEKYPSVTYFVQMVGANTSKKDVNSYIKTVTDTEVTIEDTPNYTTYQVQIDMWARKLSDIDYLQELFLDNVDTYRPTIVIEGKDGKTTTQYMMPRDLGRSLDEQQKNDEKLYRRVFSFVLDVPNMYNSAGTRKRYNRLVIKTNHTWGNNK